MYIIRYIIRYLTQFSVSVCQGLCHALNIKKQHKNRYSFCPHEAYSLIREGYFIIFKMQLYTHTQYIYRRDSFMEYDLVEEEEKSCERNQK